MTEYVKLTPEEKAYGKKESLLIQVGLLNIMKSRQNLLILRKEEARLKNQLRKILSQVGDKIKSLELHLPKTKTPSQAKEHAQVESKKHRDLELELEELRHKLAELQ